MTSTRIPQFAIACLVALLALTLLMFVAMLAESPPHPPSARGPYIAALCALALASLRLLLQRERSGAWLGLFTMLAFLPAVGPHKLIVEEAARELGPLIAVGSFMVFAGMADLLRHLRADLVAPGEAVASQ